MNPHIWITPPRSIEFWFDFGSNYSYLSTMRVALWASQTGAPWLEAFCQEVMRSNFARDRDVDDAALVTELLQQLGLDAKAVIEHAQSAENKLALREQTEEAVRRRVFGAPTFFVGREMFWGNDRLEDAIACASAS